MFSSEGNLSYPKLTADAAFSNLKIREGLKRNFGGTDGKQNIQAVSQRQGFVTMFVGAV